MPTHWILLQAHNIQQAPEPDTTLISMTLSCQYSSRYQRKSNSSNTRHGFVPSRSSVVSGHTCAHPVEGASSDIVDSATAASVPGVLCAIGMPAAARTEADGAPRPSPCSSGVTGADWGGVGIQQQYATAVKNLTYNWLN